MSGVVILSGAEAQHRSGRTPTETPHCTCPLWRPCECGGEVPVRPCRCGFCRGTASKRECFYAGWEVA